MAPGGKGANQSVACARAGGPVVFLGALGDDPFARVILDSLWNSGVQERTIRVPAPTGAAFIAVSAEGENAITVASGANSRLRPEHLLPLQDFTHLVLQLETPLETTGAYAAAARQAGLQVVLNAAPARKLGPSLLQQIDLLVVNEGELSTLVGPGTIQAQLQAAQALGPGMVLVTLGERGCLALNQQTLIEVPSHQVDVRDTTGAGDTFVGVLVAALSEGQSLEDAMRLAAVGAALACTRDGAQPSMPTRDEIERARKEQGL